MSTGAFARFQAIAAEEWRPLAFALGVVVLFALFGAIVPAGGGPDPLGIFAREFWDSFRYSVPSATVMFLIIQPVRRWGPEAGLPRIVALCVVVTVACAVVMLGQALISLDDGEHSAKEVWAFFAG